MTKDYANSAYKHQRSSSRLTFTVGIIIGVGLAVAVYWFMNYQTTRYSNTLTSSPLQAEPVTKSVVVQPDTQVAKTHPAASDETTPEVVSAPPVVQPHFDFYTELPKTEVEVSQDKDVNAQSHAPVVELSHTNKNHNRRSEETKVVIVNNSDNKILELPSQELGQQTKQDTVVTKVSTKDVGRHYIVQVASFSNYAEADKTKAQLVLMGFAVKIKAVRTNRTQYFRVLMGPFDNQTQALLAQQALQKNHFKSLLLKV